MAGRFQQQDKRGDPRRFVGLASRVCATARLETIGDGWMVDLQKLRGLEPYAPATRRVPAAKARRSLGTRARLADYVADKTGIDLNPDWMFDVQAHPRIQAPAPQRAAHHHALQPAKADPGLEIAPRAFFGGKAAPGYFIAIKLINSVGETINNDPRGQRQAESRVQKELQRPERPS